MHAVAEECPASKRACRVDDAPTIRAEQRARVRSGHGERALSMRPEGSSPLTYRANELCGFDGRGVRLPPGETKVTAIRAVLTRVRRHEIVHLAVECEQLDTVRGIARNGSRRRRLGHGGKVELKRAKRNASRMQMLMNPGRASVSRRFTESTVALDDWIRRGRARTEKE